MAALLGTPRDSMKPRQIGDHFVMIKALTGLALCGAFSAAAVAQQKADPAPSIDFLKTPVGPVVQTTNISTVGDQRTTVNTYTPGNNSSVQPSVRTTNVSPYPNQTQGATTVTLGIAIPLDSTPKTSVSTAPPAPPSPPPPPPPASDPE